MRTVTIYSTSKCNIRCKHCAVGKDQDNPRNNQTTAEMKKIFQELSIGGARFVTVLGGEATIYRTDLPELLDFAYEVGLKVSINTNLTVWKPIEEILEKPALNALIVSLDGANENTHDMMRGKGTFKKTAGNLRRLSQNNRISDQSLKLEIAFVMSGINYHETSDMLELARRFNASFLNVKNVKLVGRAAQFDGLLGFNSKALLDTYTALILNWYLSEQKFELEVFIPPSFAEYLNKRFNLNLPTSYHPACGGPDEFSYVDLYGNHLPCPAMSYEEDQNSIFDQTKYEVNLIENDIASSLSSDLFKKFENDRTGRTYKNQLFPCKYCKYNNQCQQCVAELINGNEQGNVDICKSIFVNGDSYLPNIRNEIWTGIPG